jgi:hypothetical protein
MPRGRKRRSSQADFDVAVEAVVAGASYKTAEMMTGVPGTTVREYIARCGMSDCGFHGPAPRGSPTPS